MIISEGSFGGVAQKIVSQHYDATSGVLWVQVVGAGEVPDLWENSVDVVSSVASGWVNDGPVCISGFHWDVASGQCVQDVPACPAGYHWDEASQSCVKDHDGCFIATACGASNPSLSVLRLFRDRCLPPRLTLVYYLLSPQVANLVSGHEKVKRVGRALFEWVAKWIRCNLGV